MYQNYIVHMFTVLTGVVENFSEFIYSGGSMHSYNSPGTFAFCTQNMFSEHNHEPILNEL